MATLADNLDLLKNMGYTGGKGPPPRPPSPSPMFQVSVPLSDRSSESTLTRQLRQAPQPKGVKPIRVIKDDDISLPSDLLGSQSSHKASSKKLRPPFRQPNSSAHSASSVNGKKQGCCSKIKRKRRKKPNRAGTFDLPSSSGSMNAHQQSLYPHNHSSISIPSSPLTSDSPSDPLGTPKKESSAHTIYNRDPIAAPVGMDRDHSSYSSKSSLSNRILKGNKGDASKSSSYKNLRGNEDSNDSPHSVTPSINITRTQMPSEDGRDLRGTYSLSSHSHTTNSSLRMDGVSRGARRKPSLSASAAHTNPLKISSYSTVYTHSTDSSPSLSAVVRRARTNYTPTTSLSNGVHEGLTLSASPRSFPTMMPAKSFTSTCTSENLPRHRMRKTKSASSLNRRSRSRTNTKSRTVSMSSMKSRSTSHSSHSHLIPDPIPLSSYSTHCSSCGPTRLQRFRPAPNQSLTMKSHPKQSRLQTMSMSLSIELPRGMRTKKKKKKNNDPARLLKQRSRFDPNVAHTNARPMPPTFAHTMAEASRAGERAPPYRVMNHNLTQPLQHQPGTESFPRTKGRPPVLHKPTKIHQPGDPKKKEYRVKPEATRHKGNPSNGPVILCTSPRRKIGKTKSVKEVQRSRSHSVILAKPHLLRLTSDELRMPEPTPHVPRRARLLCMTCERTSSFEESDPRQSHSLKVSTHAESQDNEETKRSYELASQRSKKSKATTTFQKSTSKSNSKDVAKKNPCCRWCGGPVDASPSLSEVTTTAPGNVSPLASPVARSTTPVGASKSKPTFENDDRSQSKSKSRRCCGPTVSSSSLGATTPTSPIFPPMRLSSETLKTKSTKISSSNKQINHIAPTPVAPHPDVISTSRSSHSYFHAGLRTRSCSSLNNDRYHYYDGSSTLAYQAYSTAYAHSYASYSTNTSPRMSQHNKMHSSSMTLLSEAGHSSSGPMVYPIQESESLSELIGQIEANAVAVKQVHSPRQKGQDQPGDYKANQQLVLSGRWGASSSSFATPTMHSGVKSSSSRRQK